MVTRLGLTLNEAKTSIKQARKESFDFLGYTFGPHCFEKHGRWYLGASPSKKSVARIKQKVGDLLVPNNVEAWSEVRDRLNQILRGWCAYFSYGTTATAYRAVDYYVYEAYAITSGDAIKCARVALLLAFQGMRSTVGWVLSNCVVSGWSLVRESGGEIQSESRMREIRMSGLMSGDGKRGGALRQRSRPSSTLPVPTIRFQILYVFLVLAHERRRIVHLAVTAHPTAEWTAQQLREAFPWDSAPRYLLRDRDRIFGQAFVEQVKAMGIKQVLSAPRSPWQRAYIERVIGTIRRECLDHMIVFNEQSLQRHLEKFLKYYHQNRTHLALEKDSPEPRPIQPPKSGRIVSIPVLGGLYHRYERRAA